MPYTIPLRQPPTTVTLATTCTLVTVDGTVPTECREMIISSDTVGSTDIIRIVYSDTLSDGDALPASGYHEIPASQLPVSMPMQHRRFFLQGSSAFEVQVEVS